MKNEVLMALRIGAARLQVLAPPLANEEDTSGPENEGDRPLQGVRARVVLRWVSTWIESFRQLVHWSKDQELSIKDAVGSCPNEFARFVSLMDVSHYVRVAEIPSLYDYAAFDLDVDLRRELPRVEGDTLLFVAGRTSFKSVSMWRFQVDLRTGVVEETAIPRRPR